MHGPGAAPGWTYDAARVGIAMSDEIAMTDPGSDLQLADLVCAVSFTWG